MVAVHAWQQNDDTGLPLSVDIHRQELTYGGLLSDLDELLGARRGDIRLQISEAALMDPACQGTVEQLVQAGYLLSVREFGTAASSLRRLGSLGFPTIRFDRSFMTGLGGRSTEQLVLETVVALAAEMGVVVGVDGVTQQRQVESLLDLGITRAQGGLFGRPTGWDGFASRHLPGQGREAPFVWHPRTTGEAERSLSGGTS